MSNLYEILANAQNGEAIDRLARQFNLSYDEAENAAESEQRADEHRAEEESGHQGTYSRALRSSRRPA